MNVTDEELISIHDQARRDHADNLLASRQMKHALINRGLDELLVGVTDPDRIAIIRRVGRLLAGVDFYFGRGTRMFELIDMAPDAIEMMIILRDMDRYVDAHWDALLDSPIIQKTNRAPLVLGMTELSEEIDSLQVTYERSGTIHIYSGYFTHMDRSGRKFLAILLGYERIQAMADQVNQALERLRTYSMVSNFSYHIGDPPKGQMS